MNTNSKLQELTKGAIFLALMIVFAMIPGIPLGFLPVPIVIQNLAVMMIVLILGTKRGTLVLATFLLLVAMGLPVLSGGRGGLAILFGPTGGYLWAWLIFPSAYWSLNRLIFKKKLGDEPSFWQGFVLLAAVDIIIVYGIGALWLHLNQGLDFWSAYVANFAFIPGDLIKVFLAVLLSRALFEANQH